MCHQSCISLALLCLAVFSATGPGGVQADIQCYDCIWTNPNSDGSAQSCKSSPTSGDLWTYPSPVNYPDSIKAQTSTKFFQVIRDAIAATAHTKTNSTLVPQIQSAPTGEQEPQALYTVLCITAALTASDGKETAQLIQRGGIPLRVPDSYRGKCLTSYPPGFEEELGSEYISYIKGKTFCYCDTNGCNNDPIKIPNSGVKPTFSALAALLSLFLLKYFS